MKNHFFSAALTLLLLFMSGAANAGFAVRTTASTADSSATQAATQGHDGIRSHQRKEIFQRLTTFIDHDGKETEHHHHGDTSGWEGIVALCCGICGFASFGILAVPAIIFGAIGMSHHKANRGLAIAGLVMGIVAILGFLFLALIYFPSILK